MGGTDSWRVVPCQLVLCKWNIKAVMTFCVRYDCAESINLVGPGLTKNFGFSLEQKAELHRVKEEFKRSLYEEMNGGVVPGWRWPICHCVKSCAVHKPP